MNTTQIKKELRWFDYITININWFALTTRSQVISPLIIPLLVQQFVGETNKGAYLGMIRLWALMFAILVQAFVGMVSDHSTSRFGKRRPFIFVGALLEVLVFILIGFSAQLEGMTGYWVIFTLYIISMIGANISHGATQGLIPDLVPDKKKGLASGIKAMLELPVPLIFVAFVVSGMIERGNLWGAIFVLISIILVAMAITMFAPEVPQKEAPQKINWRPIFRLVMMTALFTVVILFSGWAVKQILLIGENFAPTQRYLIGGLAGLAGMSIAIFLGVLFSLRVSLGEEIKDQSAFKWWVVNRLAFMVAANNLAGFMVFFLQEKFPEFSGSKAAGPASKIVMFVGIFILLSALPSGWLSDKFGKKFLSAIAAALVGIGSAIVILAPEVTGLMYVGGAVVGTGVGLFYSANWALGTELVPEDRAGQFLGLSNLAGAGAGAIGAYIGGPIADNLSYVLLMSIYGIIAVLSMFALLGIRGSNN
ncbi:MFS transporter [bacterium]|nr:MFS transporter [bacterium]